MEIENRNDSRRFFTLGLTAGLFLAAIIVGITWLGTEIYKNKLAKEAAAASSVEETSQTESLSVVNERTKLKLQAIEKLVQENYYLHEVSEEEMEEGIYDGLISSLEDKYADYYTVAELKKELSDNEGTYYGIAAYISIDQETMYPFISGIISGGSAEEAGLRAGDIIAGVDGESTFNWPLADVVAHVKGDEGTTVKLTIVRDDDAFEVDVTRKKVDTPTVTGEMLEDQIGLIQIGEFDVVTIDQFAEKYAELREKGMKAMILDMRGNPGGVFQAAVQIAQQILPEGLIVYTETKSGERSEFTCDGSHEIKIPLVVLVNGGTASAAEILTGAIKDHGVGTIMGTKTYGKGIVQKIFSLTDGSAVKMTTSAYFTPSGVSIHEKGIEPDIEVQLDVDAYYAKERVDSQMEAAKDHLRALIK